MALWSIMAAQLMMSNDLRNIALPFKEILLNKEIIAVNQDKLGIMGKQVMKVRTFLDVDINRMEEWLECQSRQQCFSVVECCCCGDITLRLGFIPYETCSHKMNDKSPGH